MSDAKEMLDQLPKSREHYTTIQSAELEALRKIAACFQKGDFDRLSWMTCDCDMDKLDYTEEFHQEMLRMVHRLQAAAKLAEDGA